MHSRERAPTTFRHEEPDRVAIDFGGTADSTIVADSYQITSEFSVRFWPQRQEGGSQLVLD